MNTDPQHKCPQCGLGMLLLRSQYVKICANCHKSYPWPLKDKQQPLIKYQR